MITVGNNRDTEKSITIMTGPEDSLQSFQSGKTYTQQVTNGLNMSKNIATNIRSILTEPAARPRNVGLQLHRKINRTDQFYGSLKGNKSCNSSGVHYADTAPSAQPWPDSPYSYKQPCSM